jgi:hypothetical protein
MDSVIEGLVEGVYVDDFGVWGSTIQEHNERLEKTLQKFQKHGLKLHRAKCQFCVKESTEGVQPDHAKVKATKKMANPTHRKGIQRVLGIGQLFGEV